MQLSKRDGVCWIRLKSISGYPQYDTGLFRIF